MSDWETTTTMIRTLVPLTANCWVAPDQIVAITLRPVGGSEILFQRGESVRVDLPPSEVIEILRKKA